MTPKMTDRFIEEILDHRGGASMGVSLSRSFAFAAGAALCALALAAPVAASHHHHAPPPPPPPPPAAPPPPVTAPPIVLPDMRPPPPARSAPTQAPAPPATRPAQPTQPATAPPSAPATRAPLDARQVPLPPPVPRGVERDIVLTEQRIIRLESELENQWLHDWDAARKWLDNEIEKSEGELLQSQADYESFMNERIEIAFGELEKILEIIKSVLQYADDHNSNWRTYIPASQLQNRLIHIESILDGSVGASRVQFPERRQGDVPFHRQLEFHEKYFTLQEAEREISYFFRDPHRQITKALIHAASWSQRFLEDSKDALARHIAMPSEARQRLTEAETRLSRAEAAYRSYQAYRDSLDYDARRSSPHDFGPWNEFRAARSELAKAQEWLATVERTNADSIANARDWISRREGDLNQARARLAAYNGATDGLQASALEKLDFTQFRLEQGLRIESIRSAEAKVRTLARYDQMPEGSRDLIAFAEREGADIGSLRAQIEADLRDARAQLAEHRIRAEDEALAALRDAATDRRIEAEEQARLAEADERARLEQEAEAARQREDELAALEEARDTEREAARLAEIEAQDAEQAGAEAMGAERGGLITDPIGDLSVVETEAERRQARAQEDMEYFMRQRDRAIAELASLRARGGDSEAEAWIASRLSSYELQIAAAEAQLRAAGGSFAGYQAEDLSRFDPYRITQTHIDLRETTAQIRALEAIGDARERALRTIEVFADADDAVNLRQMLHRIGDFPDASSADLARTADNLREFRNAVYETRFVGPMEHVMVQAFEDQIRAAEYETGAARLRLGAGVSIAFIGIGTTVGALAGSSYAAAQASGVGYTTLAFNVSTGAINGYAQDGVSGAMTGVARETLPINTVLTIRDSVTSPAEDAPGGWSYAFAIVQDLGNVASAYGIVRDIQSSSSAAAARNVAANLDGAEAAAHRAWQLDQARGRELVSSYQQAKFQAEIARASGTVDSLAEARIDRLIAQINSSDQAKLLLKQQPGNVQQIFVNDLDTRLLNSVDDMFESGMRARGWSPQAVQEFRNQSSARTVGMDRDLGLVEPSLADTVFDPAIGAERLRYAGANDPNFIADTRSFREGLTRHGTQASLDDWARDAAEVYDQAYRGRTLELTMTPGEEALQFSAASARQHLTTSRDLEAYRDVAVLLNNPDAVPFSTAWAEQTADVTRMKVDEGITGLRALGLDGAETTARLPQNLNAGSTMTEIQVAGRELLKDLDTKVVPAMITRNRELSSSGQSLLGFTARQEREIAIIRAMVSGDANMSPVVADRLLRADGGRGLAEAMTRLSGTIEFAQKL